MVDSHRPNTPANRPFNSEPAPSEPITVTPSTAVQNSSDGPNLSAKLARIGVKKISTNDAEHAADHRADEGVVQRLGRAALARHRVAVEHGGDIGGRPRDVDQDGADGAARHGGGVDRAEQDQAARRVHVEGERDEQRHRHGRAQARRRAQDQAADGAEHQHRQVPGREDLRQVADEVQALPPCQRARAVAAAANRLTRQRATARLRSGTAGRRGSARATAWRPPLPGAGLPPIAIFSLNETGFLMQNSLSKTPRRPQWRVADGGSRANLEYVQRPRSAIGR